ncbi:hypothetical protein CDAR_418971 [Caerostris darwini]|uniref:Uncharacterized protein n=1 Tax=Caerostris darwini TaxID=1538125 RepID=A0AAV4MYC1_9ARAC|nr:hypothetical protein CDAR_418971 [Caerostris darwini]
MLYSSDNETSFTSASEDIGSEDTPEELSEFELDFSSSTSSTTASPATSRATSRATSNATSPTTSPRRSPRLEKKRSRILEKEGVSFRAKRRRIVSPSPDIMVDPAASLPQSPVPDWRHLKTAKSVAAVALIRSGESSVGRYSSSVPSTRSCSPSLPPSRSSPVCRESPPAGAAIQRSPASPTPPAVRTTRSGRFHPYSRPASPALSLPPPATAARPPPPAPRARPSPPPVQRSSPQPTTRRVTRSQTGSLPVRTSSGKRRLEDSTYQTRASKRLLNAWQLTEVESKDLRQWQNSAYERFEALESLAPTAPRSISKEKKEEKAKRPNLGLNKLMDTTDLLIPTTTFARLGRGVLAEVAPEKKYHFAGAALKVLQRAMEDVAISSLVVTYDFAKHRNGVELKEKDFKLFHQIYKDSYPYFEFQT